MSESKYPEAELTEIMEAALKTALDAAMPQVYQLGFFEGFQAGRLTGYVEGVNALTPAISDGLRHGSSQCAKAMQGLTAMRAIPGNEAGVSSSSEGNDLSISSEVDEDDED